MHDSAFPECVLPIISHTGVNSTDFAIHRMLNLLHAEVAVSAFIEVLDYETLAYYAPLTQPHDLFNTLRDTALRLAFE